MSVGHHFIGVVVGLALCTLTPALAEEEPLVLESEDCREVHTDNAKPCGYYMMCEGEKQADAEPRECTERAYSRVCCRKWSTGSTECDPSSFLRVELIAPPPLIAGCVTKSESDSIGPY